MAPKVKRMGGLAWEHNPTDALDPWYTRVRQNHSGLAGDEKIRALFGNDQTTAVVYYYCTFRHNRDESEPLLRWLLGQLCRQASKIPEIVRSWHNSRYLPDEKEILDVISTVAPHFGRVCLLVDAADESHNRGTFAQLLARLGSEPQFHNIRLLVTSREYSDIETHLQAPSIHLSMDNDHVREDIRSFVRAELSSAPEFRHWPKDLSDEVEAAVTNGAKGMYVVYLEGR
jgi:hypothetical protein